MSVDVASLIFEIDSTQAVTARERLDDLEQAGARVDASARRVKTATQLAGIGMRETSDSGRKLAQTATELAASESMVERATRGATAASAEVRASRALEAAAMRELVFATKAYERDQVAAAKAAAAAARENAQAIASLEARVSALKGSIDPAYAAQSRLDAEMREASALYKMGAISASDYAKATSVLESRMDAAARGQTMLNGVMVRGAASSKFMQRAGLDLSRQFADIGVTAAMGMNPLMILIQQGPQIADIFAQAKMQGMGFTAVLGGIQAQLAPLMAILGPFLVVGAALGAMFLMLHHSAKNDLGNVAESLNLTEAQMKRVDNTGVTMGDTLQAVFKTTGQIIYSALKEPIDDLSAAFSAWYADLVSNTLKEVKVIVSVFAGAYGAIKAVWSQLPSAMADVAVSAANGVISAIEAMINKAIDSVNALMAALRPAMSMGLFGSVGQVAANVVRPIGHVELGEIPNQNKGAASTVMTDAAEAYAKDAQRSGEIIEKASSLFHKNLKDIAEKRIGSEAGDAGKGPKDAKGPADRSDERLAQIDAALAQARAEELQAQLALTEDAKARLAIEKDLIAAQLAEKQAGIERQMAKVEADLNAKRITQATGALLMLELEAIRLTNSRVASLRVELAEQEAARKVIRDEAAVRAAGIQDQIDILTSQRDIAKFGFQRRAIDREILEAQMTIERLKLEEIVATTASTSAENQIARARLEVLEAIHRNRREGAAVTAEGAFKNVAEAMEAAATAFRDQDWQKLVKSVIEAIGALREAFKQAGNTAGKIGAVAGLGSVVGGAVGGTAGKAISGAASGAMAGLVFGPLGAAAGAIIGGIAGLFSGNSEKKRRQAEEARQRAEAEAARLLAIANQRREFEIQIMELSGDSVGALAARRADELASMDASNRALQEQIYALQDQAEAASKAATVAAERASLEIRLMEASGDAIGALTAKRTAELATVDEANRALLERIFAQEDATERVKDARDVLTAAYERESGALQQTIDKFKSFSESLARFRDQLYTGPQAMLSPEEQYRAAKAAFDQTSTKALGGDEKAIGDLQAVSQAYLDASKDYYASSKGYFDDLDAVRAAVTATQSYAASQVSAAEQELAVMRMQYEATLGVKNAIVDFASALLAYQAAQASAEAASRKFDGSDYLTANDDLLAAFQRYQAGDPSFASAGYGSGMNADQFGQMHWDNGGKDEGRPMFTAPAPAAPIVQVSNDNAALVTELRSLLEEAKTDKVQAAAIAAAAAKQNEALRDELAEIKRTLRAQG